MCFFKEIFLSISIFVFLYSIYKYFVNKDNKYQTIQNYVLFLILSFLTCFSFPSFVFYFFLDIFILLSYKNHLLAVGVFLSCVLFFCFFSINFSFFLVLLGLFIGYFLIYIYFSGQKRVFDDKFLYFKGFMISFWYFSNFHFTFFSFSILFSLLIIEDIFLLHLNPIVYKKKEVMMSEVEDSLFKITHEIKNPIAVCKGYLDMIDLKNPDKASKYISIIQNEISRTLIIMDDFLSLKKLKINKDIMDFNLLLEDIKKTMYFLLKEHQCTLEIPNCDDEVYIMADYDRLKQVLINLLKNSLEASSNHIRITTKIRRNQLMVTIQDTGCGISKENLPHLGELFFTTKNLGSGVGVHLSQKIIRLHLGKLSYTSKLGYGTKVKILLPIEEKRD